REIVDGTGAQADRFMAAYDGGGELVTHLGLVTDIHPHRKALAEWDDQEAGYPDLKLADVLDMAEAVAAAVAGEEAIEERYLHEYGFRRHRKALSEKAALVKKRLGHVLSWRKTVSLISGLNRSGLFDGAGQAASENRPITSLK